MSVAKQASLALVIVLLVISVLVVAADWRLWHRYLTQPKDIADPANALWFSPRAKLGDNSGQPLPVASAQSQTLPPAALEEARHYAESMGTDAMIIAHNGIIQLEWYGPDIDQATLFQSQSLHKGLTAMALGAAIQTGAIPSADVPASMYIKEWIDTTHGQNATLTDLAYMQAGLERPSYSNSPFSPSLQLFLTGDVTSRALSTPFVAAPGEAFIWSNASTQALSIAVERATGLPWNEFLADALWSPLGGGEAYVQLDRPNGTAFSFCCLVTNARNWLRIGNLLLQDGIANSQRILPDGWVDRMTTGSDVNANYGMQLWLNEPFKEDILRNGLPRIEVPRGERLAASDAFYIEGHFSQRLHVVPSAGLVVVRLGDDRRDWDDAKLMNGLILAAQSHLASTQLTQVTPPAESFENEVKAPTPDYSIRNNWARYPLNTNAAGNAFYVYPTTYRGPTWNSDLKNRNTKLGVDAVVLSQASVLDDCCNVYAPYYRQATAASVFDRTGSGMQAYDFAFNDVRNAFEQFVTLTDDQPFILMGHSQGAFHLQRLIDEVIAPRNNLQDRLVAAYVVGISLPTDLIEKNWQGISVCRHAEQYGCIANWATLGPNANAKAYEQRIALRFPAHAQPDGSIDIACTNPLTGSGDAAEAAQNLGAIPVAVPGAYLANPIPEIVGAGCDQGILRLDKMPGPPFESLVFAGENFHFYDVALFHQNLSNDATRRLSAYLTGGH